MDVFIVTVVFVLAMVAGSGSKPVDPVPSDTVGVESSQAQKGELKPAVSACNRDDPSILQRDLTELVDERDSTDER